MRTLIVSYIYLLSFQGKSMPLLALADVTTILNLVFFIVCFLLIHFFITLTTYIPKKCYFILFSSQISWGIFYKQEIITHLNCTILWVLTNIHHCVNSTTVKIKTNSITLIYILMTLCSQPFPTPHLGNHWSILIPYNFAFFSRSCNWNHILPSI